MTMNELPVSGVAASGPGSRPSDGAASSGVSTVPASIPNAEGEESYRLNPHFRRFLQIVQPVGLAAAAWGIAREAFIPSDPDGDAEYEVLQDDQMVAGASGPRQRALAEAVHYAVMYQTDESPCTIQEVTRREISPDEAEELLASGIEARRAATAQTGAVEDESPVGEAETPNP